jgi:hypothetical protein
MPINKGFMLKQVGKTYMIIPTTNSNVEMNKIFNINEIGADIYKYLDSGNTVEETINLLLKDYDVKDSVLRPDVLEFIQALKERGIYND